MKIYFGVNRMKAIILAAGEGRRLRPLTNNIPKTMVKLFNMSLLERQIEIFQKCGINDIVVVGGYKNEKINIKNIKQYRNENYDSTNMIETLFCADDELFGSTIISYGDIIFEKSVLQSLINSNEDLSVIVDKNWEKFWSIRFTNPLEDAESLKLDDNDNILELGQNVKNINEIQGQYIGLMKFQNEGIEVIKEFYKKTKEISKNNKNPLNKNLPFEQSYMTDFIQGLINDGHKIKAILIKSGWLELDTINDFEIYNKLYRENNLSEFFKLGIK